MPTRENMEQYLVGQLGPKLAFVGKSVVADGTNPDLASAISLAVVQLGGRVADFADPTDQDVATAPNVPALFGLAALFALRDVWGSFVDVTESAQDRSQAWSSMSAEIQARLAQLENLYRSMLEVYRPLAVGSFRATPRRRSRPEM